MSKIDSNGMQHNEVSNCMYMTDSSFLEHDGTSPCIYKIDSSSM